MADRKKDKGNPQEKDYEEQVAGEQPAAADEGTFENETLTQESLDLLLDSLPEELVEEIKNLSKTLQDTRQKSEEYLDGWQRSRAEFANYRKRVEREREQIYQDTSSSIIRRYLEVLDDLERALKNIPEDNAGAEWAKGIDLIFRKLLAILESEGVKPMDAQGAEFDPNLHEAISQEDHPDFESGQVIEVVRTGYMIGERVLRPAAVRVAR
jgi:molecular chaperone GrpE